MQRYLLFDAGCIVCSSLAHRVEQESQGWLQARSLNDTDIQADLNRTRPGWHWEPMLMEKEDEHVHIYTGIAFRLKMLTGLGPQRTWHIVQLLGSQRGPLHGTNSARRNILKGGFALLGGIAFGLGLGELPKDSSAYAHSSNVSGKLKGSLRLPSDHPDIAVLKETHAVQTSTRSFGPLNWDHAYKFEMNDHSAPGYVVAFHPQGDIPSTAFTFLAVSDLSSSSNDAAGIVYQVTQSEKKGSDVTWFTLDGQSLSDSSHQLQPDALGLSCLRSCLTSQLSKFGDSGCVDIGVSCGLDISNRNPFSVNCAVFAICAGAFGVAALRGCVDECSKIA